MKVGISLKIDVSKIDKARLFKGNKGTYLDATVFVDVDEADKYGNHGMITQDVSKEEKQQGVRGEILGNCKVFWKDAASPMGVANAIQNTAEYLDDDAIDALVAQREQAKRDKDYGQADSIREHLKQNGVLLEESREGTFWKRSVANAIPNPADDFDDELPF